MFNLFNEASVLPQGAILIEKKYAKEIVKSSDFKVLLIKCESEFPSTPKRYNVLIGDSIYGLAKILAEKFGDKLDCLTDLKFTECFNKKVADRTLPVNRCIIEGDINSKERSSLSIQFVRVPYDIEEELKLARRNNSPSYEKYELELTKGKYRGKKKLNK